MKRYKYRPLSSRTLGLTTILTLIAALSVWHAVSIRLDAQMSVVDAALSLASSLSVWVCVIFVGTMMTVLLRRRWLSASWHAGLVTWSVVGALIYYVSALGTPAAEGALGMSEMLLNRVVPALILLHWMAFVPKLPLRTRDVVFWLSLPLAFATWAVGRGVSGDQFGIFDMPSLGPLPVMLNTGMFLGAFLVGGVTILGLAYFRPQSDSPSSSKR